MRWDAAYAFGQRENNSHTQMKQMDKKKTTTTNSNSRQGQWQQQQQTRTVATAAALKDSGNSLLVCLLACLRGAPIELLHHRDILRRLRAIALRHRLLRLAERRRPRLLAAIELRRLVRRLRRRPNHVAAATTTTTTRNRRRCDNRWGCGRCAAAVVFELFQIVHFSQLGLLHK